ncbi:MAG: amidohydrolase family protein [Chloroflexi bacterium]|nr:amidohydrolase family protein [Chloroflexota bacterium]
MAEFDTVIKGGTVIDGLRTPRHVADIGIADGRIAYIGKLRASDGDQVLDAEGLIVAPGFVDLHTHYDGQVYWDPYCSISGWHGVTSVVIGNCGFGFAPVKPDDRERAMLSLARNEAIPLESMQAGMPWDWETYPEFLDSLDRTPKGVNLLSYVGLSPLMMYVMGLEAAKSRLPNDAEMAEMSRILEEAIKAGGCGFSAQVLGPESGQRDYDGTPMITDTMAPETLVSFAEVLGKCRAGFIQLTGGSMELNEQLAEASGRPVIYNLILAMAQDQHGNKMEGHHKTIAWLNEANARGNRIFGQAVTVKIGYEFTLEHWNMFDTYELWREMTLGTVEERMAKMGDPDRRPALRAEHDEGKGPSAPGRDEEAEVAGHVGRGLEVLTVQEVEDPSLKHFEGLTVQEIADQSGKHVIDAFLDLGVADKLQTTWVTPPEETDVQSMSEVANSPFAIPGVSDGGAHTKFLAMGVYPTEMLSELVRDHEIMDLEQAHWRLSAYPAMAAGFKDRGWIKEGSPADIVVYDLENLGSGPMEKVYDLPAGQWRRVRRAEGYRWILVNGEVTSEDGETTGATPGRLLRYGSG